MTAEQIEDQIRQILATESDPSRLSRRLFDAEGLFGQLTPIEAERRALAQSPLFRQALHRLTELQHREAAAYVQEREAVRADAATSGQEPAGAPIVVSPPEGP